MRVVLGLAVVAALAIGAWLWLRDRGDAAEPAASAKTAEREPAGSTAPPAKPKAPAHVTKLTPDERKQIAERIAQAQAARGAHAAPERPSLPPADKLDTNDLDHIKTTMLAAMKEAIPFLAECYDKHGPKGQRTAAAFMTLTGDPDIGTVIDADQIADENGKPLDPKLDDCLRTTLQSLALPPLTEGDQVRVQYSFKFD